MKSHNYFINLAKKVALRAHGKTSPNPLVGALIVKNGKIIASGYHKKAGEPHAEVIALENARQKAKGATLYITLEPCAHFGKTPPCTDAIIKSGIKKVVIGMVDPNLLNSGKGIRILKKHKIGVECGFLEDELKKINESYIKFITKNLPFITVKVAQSLDGKIATRSRESKWITEDRSLRLANKMRRYYDAIMVGVNTVIRDDPQLTCRFPKFLKQQPKRIVVDSNLSTPEGARIFNNPGEVIIATLKTESGQSTANKEALLNKARILETKERIGQVNLYALMKKLADSGITNILVEGGGSLIGSLFDEKLVDKVIFFIAPKIIGGKDAVGAVDGVGVKELARIKRLKDVTIKKVGVDLLVEGYIKN